MKRVVLGVLVLAVCGMMIAPAAMAGKPGGGGSGSKYSTMTKDFVATNSIGKWTDGNTRWFVMFWYASNQLPPGGLIKIYNVPSIRIPGYNDAPSPAITYLQEDFHGEDLILPVKIQSLANGHYDTRTIGNIQFHIDLYNYCTANNKRVDIYIKLLSDTFNSDQYVNIDVTNTQIHLYSPANTPLPFGYWNWNMVPPPLLGTGNQDFDITIDK